MANVSTAVGLVVEYIVTTGLYNFKSLSEETQQKLIGAYGEDIENHINAQLQL